jgi:hypothetical protein
MMFVVSLIRPAFNICWVLQNILVYILKPCKFIMPWLSLICVSMCVLFVWCCVSQVVLLLVLVRVVCFLELLIHIICYGRYWCK